MRLSLFDRKGVKERVIKLLPSASIERLRPFQSLTVKQFENLLMPDMLKMGIHAPHVFDPSQENVRWFVRETSKPRFAWITGCSETSEF